MDITAQKAEDLLTGATPGPWRIGPEGSEGSYVLPDCEDKRERGKYITLVGGRVQPLDGKNARLIAAAPDLAETVIALTERLDKIAAEIRDLRVNDAITVGDYAQMDSEDRWDRGAACMARAVLGALNAEIGPFRVKP